MYLQASLKVPMVATAMIDRLIHHSDILGSPVVLVVARSSRP